jgi:hypothetical protein
MIWILTPVATDGHGPSNIKDIKWRRNKKKE